MEPVAYLDLALRAAPEMLIKYRGVSLMSAGYVGLVDMGSSYRTRLAMIGLLIQTSIRFTERCEVSLRYAIVDFDDDVLNDAFDRGRELIALAEGQLNDSAISQQDVVEVMARYQNAGKVRREQELTAGFNVYLRGHSLKWQSDIGWLRHSLRESESLNDVTGGSQFQIAF